MKLALSGCACAALLLVACDGSTGTDAGSMMGTDAGMMGTDAGMMMGTDACPPDMNAIRRQRAAGDRLTAVNCGCDMAPFATTAECESFGDLAEADACEDAAFSASFAGVGAYFTCAAGAYETLAGCYEGASCGEAALEACDMAADAALMACEASLDDTAAMAFTTAIDTCTAEDVVGPAGMCPDGGDPISTTGMAVFMGSTVAAGNDLNAPMGCITVTGGGGSADRAFRWTAPSAGAFVFDTLGSSFDTVLYLLASCDAGAMSLGCNDDLSDMDLRSRVTATLTMGQEVVVVVEGFADGTAGDFQININPM